MLEQPFKADNLLGLVFKIVSDEHGPIPNTYSQGLQDLVNMCLKKDPAERPSTSQILKLPFVRQKMAEFVQHDAKALLN